MTEPNDIREEFSPLLDNELDADARDDLEALLAQDSQLLRELEGLKRVDRLYRGLPRVNAPADMENLVRGAVKSPRSVTPFRPRARQRNLIAGLAAAAMFGVLIGGVVLRQQFIVSKESMADYAESAPLSEALTQADFQEDSETAGASEAAQSLARDVAPPKDVAAASAAPGSASTPAAPIESLESTAMSRDKPDDVRVEQRRVGAVANADAAPTPQPAPPPPIRAAAAEPETTTGNDVAMAESPPLPESAPTAGAEVMGAAKAEGVAARTRPASMTSPQTKGERVFDWRDGVWVQRGYANESTVALVRESDSIAAMRSSEPRLREILELPGIVVFKLGDAWYKVSPIQDD